MFGARSANIEDVIGGFLVEIGLDRLRGATHSGPLSCRASLFFHARTRLVSRSIGVNFEVSVVSLHEVTGTVNLIAKAAARSAAYEWQYSTDQKTWTAAPMTLQAKTGVSGLTSGTTYYFRMQSVIRTGAQDWSQIVALLVK